MKSISEKLKISEAISISLAPEPSLDAVLAGFALSESLTSFGKNVTIKFPNNKLIKYKLRNLGQKTITHPSVAITNYEIALSRKQLGIKSAQLTETADGYKIELETENPIMQKTSLGIHEAIKKPDLYIQIGEYKPGSDLDTIKIDDLILIDYDLPAPELSEIFWQVKSSSISETIYELLSNLGLPFADNIATALIAGILWKSDGLTMVSSAASFTVINKLLTAGGDYAQAVNLGLNNQTFLHSKIYAEAFAKVMTAGNGIYYATVAATNNNEVGYLRNYVPISEIYNCKVAFVIEAGQNNCKVYLKTNTHSIDLKSICKELGGAASDSEGYFSSNDPAEQVAQIVIKKLLQQLDPKPEEKEVAAETEIKMKNEEIKTDLPIDPLAPAAAMPNPMIINSQTGKIETPA